MRYKYDLYLGKCGHYTEAMMSIPTALYRRVWLKELPMYAKCPLCSSTGKEIIRKVVRVETNPAEELYLAKGMTS